MKNDEKYAQKIQHSNESCHNWPKKNENRRQAGKEEEDD